MKDRKKANGQWEKKQLVLSFRVGESVMSCLSLTSACGKRLSASQAAREIVEAFAAGHLVLTSDGHPSQTPIKPEASESPYVKA